MPHRGRLNVLCNLLDYPYGELVRKIQGLNDMPDEYYQGIDDVISHISVSKRKQFLGTGNTRPRERPRERLGAAVSPRLHSPLITLLK